MIELKNAGKLLTIRDLARILGISERTIYNRVRKNAELPFPIKAKRIGRLIRFAPEDVQRYLDKL